ncbi:glycosyltransferase family 4 protein [Fluviispira vulneris]|uniref:glycosyltransferase family 4 protein n=1 Tax=Fluviispira vulneris TaxID=2763012 RepID=UPI001648A3F8|nr:glycosyltransferase family 4 protein [Fluviispira vulneris]
MKILMLGWEYPPMISGGLATATEGLINGLISLGHKVTLVLPYFPHSVKIKGLKIVSPENPYILDEEIDENIHNIKSVHNQKQKSVFEIISQTYQDIENIIQNISNKNNISHYNYTLNDIDLSQNEKENLEKDLKNYHHLLTENLKSNEINLKIKPFTFSISNEINEKIYALGLLALDILSKDPDYNIIHAHDWMSFTAIDMLNSKYDIPVVAHIHSTEIDRAGDIHNNRRILAIEKKGLENADMIIAVSNYTKNVIIEKFGIMHKKIKVVYNANNDQHITLIKKTEKSIEHKSNKQTVTFVGRITFQKGPSYFVFAAQKVLKINPNVIFKVVGTGDLLPSMKQLIWELGIDKNFIFSGFLNAEGVQNVLNDSSLFVMPSVSEPFGIVALEAIAKNIPVIISKQSGVSEVLNHAMKVDFWDTDLMADRILSILKYKPIRNELVENSLKDLSHRTWKHSAQTLINAYSDFH